VIELPEAIHLAAQLHETLQGKTVATVVANHSPHKWAWFHGDPDAYEERMAGLTVRGATSRGSMVEVDLGERLLVYAEGVSPRYWAAGERLPRKHQLLVSYDDGSSVSASVQMYGGLWCWDAGQVENPYYWQAREKPTPLDEGFDEACFAALIEAEDVQNKSVKAFLATEQRVPGLGNGVLQDILYAARLHPKRKVETLKAADRRRLHRSVRRVLADMTRRGGRDTEKDLFGEPGGYVTKLSRNTVGDPCGKCGTAIAKEAYLGGSVYYCATCQPL